MHQKGNLMCAKKQPNVCKKKHAKKRSEPVVLHICKHTCGKKETKTQAKKATKTVKKAT